MNADRNIIACLAAPSHGAVSFVKKKKALARLLLVDRVFLY